MTAVLNQFSLTVAKLSLIVGLLDSDLNTLSLKSLFIITVLPPFFFACDLLQKQGQLSHTLDLSVCVLVVADDMSLCPQFSSKWVLALDALKRGNTGFLQTVCNLSFWINEETEGQLGMARQSSWHVSLDSLQKQMPKITQNIVSRAHVPMTSTADRSELLTYEPCPYLQVMMSVESWGWKPHLLTPELDFSALLKFTLRAWSFMQRHVLFARPM